MRTQAKIIFGLYDLTAKEDSSLNTSDKQNFSNLEELKQDIVKETKYATLENNFFNLDGSKILLNSDVGTGIGLCSKSMSDKTGIFENSPNLIINFETEHSSNGITFQFSEDNYCNDLNIKFYNNDTLLEDMDFQPNESTYFCSVIVQKYNKLEITFRKTHIPYRYLKLINIIYGQNKVFEPNEIVSANILEEVNLLSDEVSINTFEFSIYSRDEAFNMLNPKGVYKLLQTRQMFKVYETNEDKEIDMGTFYLDEWKNETEAISNMKAIDLIGVMDKTTFYGGIYYNKPVFNIITEIIDSANIRPKYIEIDEELKTIILSGHIPICTHREALQQVLFVIGAVADCSRSDKIKIYKVNESSLNLQKISYSRKKQDSEIVELNDIVTGVQTTAHKYLYNTDSQIYSEQEELFNNELDVGEQFITFSDPVYGIDVTGSNIHVDELNCNYIKLTIYQKTNVLVTGYKYKHVTQVYESKINDDNSDKENILKVTDATLIDVTNAQEIADRILKFYQKTYKLSVDFKLNDEQIGDVAIVETLYNQKLKGNINKLDIDLTGGFVASTTITGSLYEEENNEETNI